jgi:hypothetical protein
VAFRAYVEQFLAPTLAPGDVVVLDNLAADKVDGVRQAIAAADASILYLPPYSPDLAPGSQHRPPTSVRSGAPIEQLFAKLKAPPAQDRGAYNGRALVRHRPPARDPPARRMYQLPRPLRLSGYLT